MIEGWTMLSEAEEQIERTAQLVKEQAEVSKTGPQKTHVSFMLSAVKTLLEAGQAAVKPNSR